MTSPAETLRSAAILMRERAGKATPGPWQVVFIYGSTPAVDGPGNDGHLVGEMHQCDDPGHEVRARANARHAASWHPLVALAVADWLDMEADMAGLRGNSAEGQTFHALTVARAYLNETEGPHQ